MITVWKTPLVATVEQVVKDLKLQLYSTGLLKEINNTGSDLMVTCPFHSGGKEHNPSCGVLLKEKVTKSKTYEAGTVHCYTCGYTADLPQFVADFLGLENPLAGFKWLVGKYNYSTQEREALDLNLYRGTDRKISYMDETDVKEYQHNLLNSSRAYNYLQSRGIFGKVMSEYEVGYDPLDDVVLFPVKDLDGRVLFYKGRSVAGKSFYNAKDIDKSSVVYGLYELCRSGADPDTKIWITESEIDALSLREKGEAAVALMGSHISEAQCKELEKTPYRRFVLATDNDPAGRKGAALIKRELIPKGFRFTNLLWRTSLKDVNELITEHGDSWSDYLTGY